MIGLTGEYRVFQTIKDLLVNIFYVKTNYEKYYLIFFVKSNYFDKQISKSEIELRKKYFLLMV